MLFTLKIKLGLLVQQIFQLVSERSVQFSNSVLWLLKSVSILNIIQLSIWKETITMFTKIQHDTYRCGQIYSIMLTHTFWHVLPNSSGMCHHIKHRPARLTPSEQCNIFYYSSFKKSVSSTPKSYYRISVLWHFYTLSFSSRGHHVLWPLQESHLLPVMRECCSKPLGLVRSCVTKLAVDF